jgi:hypothetical protein
MAVGSKLYGAFTNDPLFRKAFDLIEKLPQGAKITVKTNAEAFPWELFYPKLYDGDGPPENYQPSLFWGRRFQIEQLLYVCTDEEKLPPQRDQPGKLYVSMGLNETIDQDWEKYSPRPVMLQKEYCDSTLKNRGEHFEKQADILRIFREQYATTFVYAFCHGDRNLLRFEEKGGVDPQMIWPKQYPNWPLVFLNACSAGNVSPLAFDSFRTSFRAKKAAGLIAPSFPVPTLFAALFGKAVLAEYVERRAIGDILFDLRGRLLDNDNPLGLLYTLQCPLDVKAPAN